MEEDTVVGLPRPGGTVEGDPLLTVLREGARHMLTHAIEAEALLRAATAPATYAPPRRTRP
jgi:hypothetical protein